MKRLSSILVVGMLVATVAACSGSTGGLGSVPSAVPIASDEPGGPDLTPGPSNPPSPSSEPSEAPGASPSTRPSAAPTATPAPSRTTIVRAYFVLGGEPGSVGLVPVLREVPETTAVARAAMNAVLAGPTAAESGDRTMS